MRDVVRHLIEALEAGRELILCQVVETRGSTPQKAGALMLVDPDGGQVGTLGGGCVENEVKQKAIRQLGRTGAELHSFVLDHDYAWADGLICGGKMVIADRGPPRPEAARLLPGLPATARGRARGSPRRSSSIPSGVDGLASPGRRFLFDAGRRRCVAGWPVGAVPAPVSPSRSSRWPTGPGRRSQAGVALLPTLPRVRLVIVGAGHVGQAVADLAAQADFDVWVVDDRQPVRQCRAVPDGPADRRRADRGGPARPWRSRRRPTP